MFYCLLTAFCFAVLSLFGSVITKLFLPTYSNVWLRPRSEISETSSISCHSSHTPPRSRPPTVVKSSSFIAKSSDWPIVFAASDSHCSSPTCSNSPGPPAGLFVAAGHGLHGIVQLERLFSLRTFIGPYYTLLLRYYRGTLFPLPPPVFYTKPSITALVS